MRRHGVWDAYEEDSLMVIVADMVLPVDWCKVGEKMNRYPFSCYERHRKIRREMRRAMELDGNEVVVS